MKFRRAVMAAAGASLCLVAGGCNGPSVLPANNSSSGVDINGAAEQAQGDIDTYASNALQTPTEAATSAPLPSPNPVTVATQMENQPPAPGELGGLTDDGTPVSELPFTPDSAQGAAQVVQSYFALIEAGKYREAWQLWSDGGKESGMSPKAFSESFAKYASYHANIGAPGRIDAGAGQRYVTVPVQVYGRMKQDNNAFNLRGEITLHRTANIDGATKEDKSWHVTAVKLTQQSLKMPIDAQIPAPSPPENSLPAGMPAMASANYSCADGSDFHIAFDNRAHTGTISGVGIESVMLVAQRTGSGIWYKGGGYTLRGKGNAADLTRPGKEQIRCTAGGARETGSADKKPLS